ncbi:hypothetical protein L3V86_06170 [Thiotrichales bacterium 19S11-10]|nr:hypothetical protein [Thiotrichales bacterium 19S11-10]
MIQVKRNNHQIEWNLNESLSFNLIMQLQTSALEPLREVIRLNKKNANLSWHINLDQVKTIDSSGLSWLLLQRSLAAKYNIALSINGFEKNTKAQALAKAQGVANLILSSSA